MTETATAPTVEDRLKEFVACQKAREAGDAAAKTAKARMAELAPPLLDHFQKNEMQNMRISGRLVHIWHQLRAYAEEGQADALVKSMKRREDMKYMVKLGYNAMSLWAWVRELPKDKHGEPLIPRVLKGKIRVQHVYELRVKK